MRFLFLILFSMNVYAAGPAVESIQTVTQDHAHLKGVRWVNAGKNRILLVHGFSENTAIFQDLALKLHEMDYDVYAFNFRGHGSDDQKSLVEGQSPKKATATGVYGFDRVVTQDMPAMIDYVYDGKPIVVLGHSLGGSALRFFLTEETDYISKVKVLVSVGAPANFQKSDLRYKLWTKLPDSVTNWALKPGMRKYLGKYIFSGLVNEDNVTASDRLYEECFSLIPVDIIDDVQRWNKTIFSSREGLQYEGMPVPLALKFVQVAGGADNLVPLSEIMNEHKKFKIVEEPIVKVMKNFGHIDLVYDRPSARLLSHLVEEATKKQ